MIEDSGAACVVWSPEFAAEIEAALADASPAPAHQLAVDGTGRTFSALMAETSSDLRPAPATADSDCFWLYTSGSTGSPKGVVHAHRDMVVTSQYYGVDVLGITAADIHLSAAKLFFAYGLGNGMTFPLWTGGQSVLFAGRPTPMDMFEHIERFQPSLYYAVPTLFAAQLSVLDGEAPDLSSLRACISAGEPLPARIFERWREQTQLAILDGIGTTEILHIFIANGASDARAGVSGKLVPGYEARILDDQGAEVGPDEVGHLWVRGASVMSRYWNQPERTAAALSDGWIRTGDSYSRDAAGYFTCHGRSDDMLKVGGIWVSPVEIEARLISHPAVLEAAVVGRFDDHGLTKPEAYVVLKDREAPREISWPKSCERSARRDSPGTSTRAGCSSWTTCPRQRPARSSASSCGPKPRGAEPGGNDPPAVRRWSPSTPPCPFRRCDADRPAWPASRCSCRSPAQPVSLS